MTDLPRPRAIPTSRSRPFDPPLLYSELRSESPISQIILPDGKIGWLVTRYADVQSILSSPDFSSELHGTTSPARNSSGSRPASVTGAFVGTDPPEHTRYRKSLSKYFTPRSIHALLESIESSVQRHIRQLRAERGPIDFVDAFARPVPLQIIGEFLGIPESYRSDFAARASVMQLRSSSREEIREVGEANRSAIEEILRERSRIPERSLLFGLLSETGANFAHEEVVGLATQLFLAGYITTSSMFGLGMYALLKSPDRLDQLIKNPNLIPNAVDELLRYLNVVQFGIMRRARRDTLISGCRISADEAVVLALGAANRDPERFANPDHLDWGRPDRFHLAFGFGRHQCIGQHLAKAELICGFTELLSQVPSIRLGTDTVELLPDGIIYGVERMMVCVS